MVAGAARPPRAGPAGGLQDQPAALGEGAAWDERRSRAVGRAEARLRSGGRDRAVRLRRSTGICSPGSPPTRRRSSTRSWSRGATTRSRSATKRRQTRCSTIWRAHHSSSSSVATRERKRHAPPPFITSKLQQTARFPVKKTMMVAQQLYEGIELPGEGAVGLITYMRTDSTRVSDQALQDVREHIGQRFGARLRSREAELLPRQGERAGCARSDSPDFDAVRARSGAAASDARPVLALSVDLEPLRRVADAAGAVRRDDGGHRGGRLPVSRQGVGAEVQRLARRLRTPASDAESTA